MTVGVNVRMSKILLTPIKVRSLSKPECLHSFQKRKTDAVIERSKKSVIGQLKTSPVKVTWSECFTYKTRNCINKIHD